MQEKNMDLVPLAGAPTGDGSCSPGVCPDQESSDHLRCGTMPNPPSHTGQGY